MKRNWRRGLFCAAVVRANKRGRDNRSIRSSSSNFKFIVHLISSNISGFRTMFIEWLRTVGTLPSRTRWICPSWDFSSSQPASVFVFVACECRDRSDDCWSPRFGSWRFWWGSLGCSWSARRSIRTARISRLFRFRWDHWSEFRSGWRSWKACKTRPACSRCRWKSGWLLSCGGTECWRGAVVVRRIANKSPSSYRATVQPRILKCENFVLVKHGIIGKQINLPGLHDESDQTACPPTSRTSPLRSEWNGHWLSVCSGVFAAISREWIDEINFTNTGQATDWKLKQD